VSELPASARIWNLVRGALASRARGVVADLGVADALAAGPRAVEDLATELGADADTLHRHLRALASDGVFEEHAQGVFADFWAWLGDHPSERASFDRAMASGKSSTADRLASVDWRGDEPHGAKSLQDGLIEARCR
jgi:hypothetical protein